MQRASVPFQFFLIFTLSGFCGLIYESIWSHYLKLFLGHAAYAQTLVLAIFMGGMAIGSIICSRYSSRWRNLVLSYALVEAVIGILALVFHNGFDAFLFASYESLMPAMGNPALVTVYKWLSSALIILPQSILLGMTFPLMSSGLMRRYPAQPGAVVSMLYFTNSIGAATGVLVCGFVLLQAFGLPGTIRLAGLANLLLAVLVWYLVRDRGDEPGLAIAAAEQPTQTEGRWFWFFLAIAFFTGAASFIYEIAWIRMLSLVLGASTHAFELMLSAFILGLALGGLWIRKRIDSIAHPVRFLAIVQGLMALAAILTLPLYDVTFDIMAWMVGNLDRNETGYLQFNLLAHGIAMMIMLPATFFAGMTLPLITYTLLRQKHGEKAIGAVYGANTLGAIVGVFFATHWAMPALGLKGLLVSGAVLDMILAVVILWLFLPRVNRRRYLAFASPALALFLLVAVVGQLNPFKSASGVYRHGHVLDSNDIEIVYHGDGKAASIDLIRNTRSGHLTISTNGKPDATINMSGRGPASPDEATMALASALPLALQPRARTAGVIGMGSGMSTNTLLLSPGITVVDTVEIEPAIVEAAQGFRPKVELAYTSPISHIHIDDAKTYFSTHNKRYDIIVSEPSNPWVSGIASLFTREFYRMIQGYLNEDGMLVQWLQLYEIDMELIATVAKALAAEFKDYHIYATDDEDVVFITSNSPIPDQLSMAHLNTPAMMAELRAIGVRHTQDLALHKIGSRKVLEPLFASYSLPANSDYYPVLDQNAARTRFLARHAGELVKLRSAPIPVLRLLGERPPNFAQTRVTPNPYLTISDRVYAATLLRDYLVHDRLDRQYPRIDARIRTAVGRISATLSLCDPKAGLNIDDLLQLAAAVNPYLLESELSVLWGGLLTSPCLDRLSTGQARWLELLAALATGQARQMQLLGEALLSQTRDPERVQYLQDSIMLGYLLSGRAEQAYRFWQAGEKQPLDKLPLASRLVVAHVLVLRSQGD